MQRRPAHLAASEGGFGRRALRRLQERRDGSSRRRARRCGGCARLSSPRRRSMRWRNTHFRASRPRAPLQSRCGSVFAVQGFRASARAGARAIWTVRRSSRPGSAVTATELRASFDIDGAQVVHADVRGRVFGGRFPDEARAPRNRAAHAHAARISRHVDSGGAARRARLPASVGLSGQTDWRGVLKMAPEPARERSLRVSSTLVGLEMKLPAPLDKAATTPLPSWLEIQWPAIGGPAGTLALGSVVQRLLCIGARCRRHASRARGAEFRRRRIERERRANRQCRRLGAAPGLGRLAALESLPAKMPSRWPTTCATPSSMLPNWITWVGVSRCVAGSRGRRAQLAHHCRRSQCERNDHDSERREFERRLEPAV